MTVIQKQCLLTFLGYDTGGVDGIWGEKSRQALRACQEALGIAADGIWGQLTEEAVLAAVAACREEPETESSFWETVRYWTKEEFRCRCGEYHAPYCDGFPAQPDETLVRLLDDIRAHFGRPAHRSSGIRCRQHNIDSKGVSNSRHLSGKAMDFFLEGVSGEAVRAYAAADPRCRYTYVIEGNCVHVDVE